MSGHGKLVRLTIRNFSRQNNRLNSRQKFGLNFSLQGREGRGFLVAISILGLTFSRVPDYFRSFEGWMFLCKIYASRGRFGFLGINIKWTLHQATADEVGSFTGRRMNHFFSWWSQVGSLALWEIVAGSLCKQSIIPGLLWTFASHVDVSGISYVGALKCVVGFRVFDSYPTIRQSLLRTG